VNNLQNLIIHKSHNSTQGFSVNLGVTAASGLRPPHCRGFMITLRHTTLCSTPLDKWRAQRRDMYLTTHNNHKKRISMTPAIFEPASQKPRAAGPHIRPCGHRDRQTQGFSTQNKTRNNFMEYLTVTVCDRHSTILEKRDLAIRVKSIGNPAVSYNCLSVASALWICVYWHRTLYKNETKLCY
jgi:hypothetical protein